MAKSCKLRHPKLCTKFKTGSCRFWDSQGIWQPYLRCSFLHPPTPYQSNTPLPPTNLSQDNVAMLAKEEQLPPSTKLRKLEVDLAQATQRIQKLEAIVQLCINQKGGVPLTLSEEPQEQGRVPPKHVPHQHQ